jgi:hypothetical protein
MEFMAGTLSGVQNARIEPQGERLCPSGAARP